MSILTGPEIRRLVRLAETAKAWGDPPPVPGIEIEPFDPAKCGPNSYDVTLSDKLLVYHPGPENYEWLVTEARGQHMAFVLDMKKPHRTKEIVIPPEGLLLLPGKLYLGCTNERTKCDGLVPWFDGRSSVGRLGLFVHVTAGRGDDAFDGHWTLEMVAVQPIRIYSGVRIGQISFMTTEGERAPYAGKYQRQERAPRPSELWRDFAPPAIVEEKK